MTPPIDVYVKLVREGAALPNYQSEGASGLDLSMMAWRRPWDHVETAEKGPVNVGPGRPAIIFTGIAIQVPRGFEGQVRPRSGASVQGMIPAFGTIDADYRGEVGVILWSFNSKRIEPGDRVAQLVIAPVQRVQLFQVAELSGTVRGANGYGSTGVR